MDAEPSGTTPAEPRVSAELRVLVQSAQAGNPAALPHIRRILDEHPEVWRHVGDLATLAERAWIAVLAADHPVAVESMKRTVAAMKADLAGENPTRIERLLVDQVVACWMEVNYLETVSAAPGRSSLDQSDFRLKRLESAQRRYLSALRTLTSVRTLALPGLAPTPAVKLHDPAKQRA
jgi:hypothetical protein